MSAALQFTTIARAAAAQRQWRTTGRFEKQPQPGAPESERGTPQTGFGPARHMPGPNLQSPPAQSPSDQPDERQAGRPVPPPNLAFYRKHTESLLRRYLLASMLVGRSPAIFQGNIGRGWATHRRLYTFEDCVIFVLDVEKSLAHLPVVDRQIVSRVVLQEYSLPEAALLFNKSQRIIALRLADALDRLTAILIDNGTLTIPNGHSSKPEGDSEG